MKDARNAERGIVALREEKDQLQTELQTTVETIEERSAELAALTERLQHAGGERSPADIDSQIFALKRQLEDVELRRDRYSLLANIIRMAERRFREKHQPDVLKEAAEYLNIISGGRYVGIEQAEDSVSFQVSRANSPVPLAADTPLSRGTLDQVFLALRLALVEHIDREFERLPLFMDEILVNWDSNRRQHGYQVLRRLARSRQVFFFTCHSWLAEELQESLEAHCIDLDGLVPQDSPD
jgi:uncharacterized protein YhaN